MVASKYGVSIIVILVLLNPTTQSALPQSVAISPSPRSTPTHPGFRTCDEQVCASRISACQIMQSCTCQLPDCSCCADCTRCLGSLWSDCCDCLGLCLAHISRVLPFHAVSTFGNLPSSIPSLFDALSYGTDGAMFVSRPQSTISSTRPSSNGFVLPVDTNPENTPTQRTVLNTVTTIIVEMDPRCSKSRSPTSISPTTVPGSRPAVAPVQSIQTGLQAGSLVCKVAFFDSCCSLAKCKISCQSMGASRFRWFHNGCCQCVGDNCVDYGGAKSLCKNCMH